MGVYDEQQMERKDRRKGARKPARREAMQSEFINLELSGEQLKDYRVWRDDFEAVMMGWGELLDDGYRVNTKYDDYSSAYAAFIIPDVEHDNAGYILTGRGGNPYRAITEAIYKHFSVLHGAWASHRNRPTQTDDPDF